MRSLSGNFDVSPTTGNVASAPADGQPVDTARLWKFFGEILEDFGPVP
jgi:hypothetical protein